MRRRQPTAVIAAEVASELESAVLLGPCIEAVSPAAVHERRTDGTYSPLRLQHVERRWRATTLRYLREVGPLPDPLPCTEAWSFETLRTENPRELARRLAAAGLPPDWEPPGHSWPRPTWRPRRKE